VFYAGFACCLAVPSAICKFEAALIEQAAAASVHDDFTVTQVEALRLCGGKFRQPVRCCGLSLAHQPQLFDQSAHF
jgi:hypothetical protein